MNDKYTIIAAPRTPNGSYWMTDGNPVYLKEFATESAMYRFWTTKILPKTSSRSGKAFEIAMVITRDGKWDFVEQPRYADTPLMKPKDESYNVMTC